MISRRGQIPLWTVLILAAVALVAFALWTRDQTSAVTADGRETIVFWGDVSIGDEIYNLIHEFERKNPQYHVIISAAAARDITADSQRLLCAVAGNVPPDLVWFDRFAIGEWAARGALLDLRPMLQAQASNDPYRINLVDYYDWAIAEASYAPPGSTALPGIFGIPTDADIRALFINSDALRQVGLVDERGAPRPPRDWDELRDYASKLTVYRQPDEKRSGIVRLGFAPNYGNSWLYLYAWEAGGAFMSAERTRVTMDTPQNVRALRYMTDVYDDLGGIAQVKAFEQSQNAGAVDPFILDRLAMRIDGDWSIENIAAWRPSMDFIVVPPPMPADQIAQGRGPITWSGGFAYVIPTTAVHKEGAFKFIQYASSEEGVRLLERGKREQKESEGRLYLVHGRANRKIYEALVAEAIEQNLKMPAQYKQAYAVFRELYPRTLIRPVTSVGQLLWNQHMRALDAGVNHQFRAEAVRTGLDEAQVALATMGADVQRELDRQLNPPPPTMVNWKPIFAAYALLVTVPFIGLLVAYRRRRREFGYRAGEVASAMMFLSPWVVGFVVLVGGPILFSIVLSFTRYDVLSPARAVGLANYREVFADPVFYKSLANTGFMILQVPIGMAVSLAIALLLNRAIRGIGLYRAGFYLPVVMPLVATGLLWTWLLNPSHGAINEFLAWLYGTPIAQWIERIVSRFTAQPFHFELPLWLYDPAWSKPSLILMNLWKAGGGMIIWLAGLQAIPGELYEAANIDGAGAWRRFRHITLPMLSPFILFNFIIGVIATMQIFGEAYIMTAGGPVDSTLFYAYYLFKQAFQFFRMGYASALAWILFVIVLALTLLQLWFSKKWVHYEQP